MGKFRFTETGIEGLYEIEPGAYADGRGYFMETYNRRDFLEAGLGMDFVQENQSRSGRGVLRGLHCQERNPQGKLVRVLSGEVYDVAVDMRKESPTYGKWHGTVLSGENRKQLYIPERFAHGFAVLGAGAEFMYKCTRFYDPLDERGIAWNDPDIGIEWPGTGYELSEKDRKWPRWNRGAGE
jgi:dTDP-4-dehydrorhamnose 3,5-epimerase